MTINEATKMLEAKKKCLERETSGIDADCNNHNCDNCDLCYEQGNMGEQKETLKYAVEIMRKYQMIQEIYKRFQKDGNYYHHVAWLDVMKVLEDGND